MKRLTMLLASTLLFAAACDDSPTDPATAAPTVLSTVPLSAAPSVTRNVSVTANFSEAMTPGTLNTTTFVLMNGGTLVPATVTYTGTTAILKPTNALAPNTLFTATISTGAQDVGGMALAAPKTWSFTTVASAVNGPTTVNLGTAAGYAVLAKSAISTTGATSIVGNVGLSPAAGSFITGFALSAPPTTFTTSALVTGQVRAANYDAPTPANLTTAVLDMQAAYTDAAGRTLPDFTELGAGDINGLTLEPGLYKWGTGLTFANGVTLSGGPTAVWILQVAQNLTVGDGAIVTLSGGALAQNVFWQVAGAATFGTTSAFKGIILSQTGIVFNTGSSFSGRALAQTAVTLGATTVVQP